MLNSSKTTAQNRTASPFAAHPAVAGLQPPPSAIASLTAPSPIAENLAAAVRQNRLSLATVADHISDFQRRLQQQEATNRAAILNQQPLTVVPSPKQVVEVVDSPERIVAAENTSVTHAPTTTGAGLFQAGPVPMQTYFADGVLAPLTKKPAKELVALIKDQGTNLSEAQAMEVIDSCKASAIDELIKAFGEDLPDACVDAILEKRQPRLQITLLQQMGQQLGHDELLTIVALNKGNAKVSHAVLDVLDAISENNGTPDFAALEAIAQSSDSGVATRAQKMLAKHYSAAEEASVVQQTTPSTRP